MSPGKSSREQRAERSLKRRIIAYVSSANKQTLHVLVSRRHNVLRRPHMHQAPAEVFHVVFRVPWIGSQLRRLGRRDGYAACIQTEPDHQREAQSALHSQGSDPRSVPEHENPSKAEQLVATPGSIGVSAWILCATDKLGLELQLVAAWASKVPTEPVATCECVCCCAQGTGAKNGSRTWFWNETGRTHVGVAGGQFETLRRRSRKGA
mmetsp:Transcript_100832/g.284402  ORF Transcript_100832/g.284402 Transcript_100832/m.284402 type:complete len:208 (-) Transcript_100832:477-1100(-)